MLTKLKSLQLLFFLALFATLSVWALAGNPANAKQPVSELAEATEYQVPLFDEMGDLHHPISTDSALAQRYFDQGLTLAYGFNHAEAARSFREAARLDPNCALCYWGVAYVLGPNINAGMADDAVPEAYSAIQKAIELADHSSDREKAYIQALATRYVADPVADRSALDKVYADAMGKVAQQYPDDLDASTLYAEALMDTTPWNYWTAEGDPRPATRKLLNTLESVLRRNPNHAGANHLYIHATEASLHPEWAEAAADRLRTLVPGSSHLVHMPAHTYIRVGRYHDSAIANQKAIAADKDYLTQCHAQGIYPLAYMPHNDHFLWASATMEGRRELAISAARTMSAKIDQEMMRADGMGFLQDFWITPLYALTRFGQWDEILAEPQPAADLIYPNGVWRYARGMALTAKGEFDQAARELSKLTEIAANPALEKITIFDLNSTDNLMKIAFDVLAGELAAKQGNYNRAIAHLEKADEREDKLNYAEPEAWHHPVRQSLGAVLLEAGRAAEAEAVYREDLVEHPRNGWSLFGLAQSLEAQGKSNAAQIVQKRFEEAWRYADVTLTSSRI